MKDGRYPYSFDNGYDLLSLGPIVLNCIDLTDNEIWHHVDVSSVVMSI